MKIDETLKSNLIADVENTLGFDLSDSLNISLKRAFEITIGHHYANPLDPLAVKPERVGDEEIEVFLDNYAKPHEEPKPDTSQVEEHDFKCSKCGKEFNDLDALAWHKTYKGECNKASQVEGMTDRQFVIEVLDSYKDNLDVIDSYKFNSVALDIINELKSRLLKTATDDYKQYITNLLYNAYEDGKQGIESSVFDEFVEKQIELLKEDASQTKHIDLRGELIKIGTEQRTRAVKIAYQFYDKYNDESNSLLRVGGETNKMLADRRKQKADIARQVGNAISGSNALTGDETIEDRITNMVDEYLSTRSDIKQVTDKK
jgi:hypothetical protein